MKFKRHVICYYCILTTFIIVISLLLLKLLNVVVLFDNIVIIFSWSHILNIFIKWLVIFALLQSTIRCSLNCTLPHKCFLNTMVPIKCILQCHGLSAKCKLKSISIKDSSLIDLLNQLLLTYSVIHWKSK